jgi:hypothetical protein
VARTAAQLRRTIYEFQDCITAVEKCEKRTFALARIFVFLSFFSSVETAKQTV